MCSTTGIRASPLPSRGQGPQNGYKRRVEPPSKGISFFFLSYPSDRPSRTKHPPSKQTLLNWLAVLTCLLQESSELDPIYCHLTSVVLPVTFSCRRFKLAHYTPSSCLPHKPTVNPLSLHSPSVCQGNPHTTLLRSRPPLMAAWLHRRRNPAQASIAAPFHH